jgi:1-deoxy-D-xylulose-5-phosphate reductoisomerase
LRKRVAILGSTGSIGRATLDVLRRLEGFEVRALSAHHNLDRLAAQVAEHRPTAVAVTSEGAPQDFASVTLHHGPAALVELVERDDVDVVVHAVVGAAGVPAALACVRAGKTLLLANKESLVVAGELLMSEANRCGAVVLPIDSEHSALHQAMRAGRRHEIDRLILTASGGPFRTWTAEQIAAARIEDALRHPTWSMGGKITIDSATMFNKALEIIEAVRLYDWPANRVDVVIHPQSVVHSFVRFVDGSLVAQASPPDMRLPIQYALTYPDRVPASAPAVDFAKPHQWTFEPPDAARFPALSIGYAVAAAGGTAGATMNAANEVAVEAFLAGVIRFDRIASVVQQTLDALPPVATPTEQQLYAADEAARERARSFVKG